ncbi:MAG: hypothetical protein J7L47_02200 [Candidatus Odinarchaeota archaeon]|nr:hypothetical protein [Candidatus Odinarchaeota archaeon]
MPRVTPDGHVYFKVVLWGPKGSGKTTTIKELYLLTTKGNTKIFPVTPLSKIDRNGSSTIFFDHGIFQIGKIENGTKGVFLQVFTVAGSERFKPIRKVLLRDIDGIVFVFDGQSGELEKNEKSIRELTEILRNENVKLGKDILFFIQINYPNKNIISKVALEKIKKLFIQENLVSTNFSEYVSGVFETVATQQINIYEMFETIANQLIDKYLAREINIK